MDKLISELSRLYLPPGAAAPEALARHVQGLETLRVSLAGADGRTRAVMIPFRKAGGPGDATHWTRLCEVANALQTELGLPAPAVSVTGASAYGLWLSLGAPVPVARMQAFVGALHAAWFADLALDADLVGAPVELPPCLNPRTGSWAAFIHPGMGASFIDEPGLEMAPPLAGQVAFLEGLESMGAQQFEQALARLQRPQPAAPPAPAGAVPEGLLLKDATLEDIVRHLHAKNIEPTFRHLLPGAA